MCRARDPPSPHSGVLPVPVPSDRGVSCRSKGTRPGDIRIVCLSRSVPATTHHDLKALDSRSRTRLQGRMRVRAAARRPMRRRVRGGPFKNRPKAWFDQGQPCETDWANPCSSSADNRRHHRDRCDPQQGPYECDATDFREKTIGIGRSVLTFQKLRTLRQPPVGRLASRCASNRVSQPTSNQNATCNRSRPW